MAVKEALDPRWHEATRVHDWRNYVTRTVREMWDTFTDEQKIAIAEMADAQASAENWD